MKKVLIIEDEVAIANMYKFKLAQNGYEAKVCLNGEDGLTEISHFNPDLILLDLRMPGMSGVEVLKKLRTSEEGAKIRVVILTNISRDDAPSEIRFLNIERYIVKAHHTPAQVADMVSEIIDQ